MSNRSWIIFGIVVLGFLGAMFAFSQSNKIDLENVEVGQVIENTEANGDIEEHVYGKKDSKVVLVEYADYQCAGCASMSKIIKALSEEYKDQMAFVFRNFTLDGHPNALSAAAAVESASIQGKFWEMNELIFENQVDWANANVSERNELYMSYARELGLDEDKFK
ncbi:MAG: thioredoxin domain-containing protein, partial [Candidatus Sacchiramonaceae bacterium]|nr:thioredoxin domain-containing protein [Candidatus Saccharimonadaceae bacterium]